MWIARSIASFPFLLTFLGVSQRDRFGDLIFDEISGKILEDSATPAARLISSIQ